MAMLTEFRTVNVWRLRMAKVTTVAFVKMRGTEKATAEHVKEKNMGEDAQLGQSSSCL